VSEDAIRAARTGRHPGVTSHCRGPGFPELVHLSDVHEAEVVRELGRAEHDLPEALEVGTPTTVTFTFSVGARGVRRGGRLGVCWRWPLDWRDLQSTDPTGDGFVTVVVAPASPDSTRVHVVPRYLRMGGAEPWHHLLEVVVEAGDLSEGDVVRLVCGDRSGGGRGWQAPTCTAVHADFVPLVDPDGVSSDGGVRWYRLPDLAAYRLLPGPPARLVAVAPSHAVVGAEEEVLVRLEDGWGNPVTWPEADADVRFEAAALGGEPQVAAMEAVSPLRGPDPRSRRVSVRFLRAGTFDVRAQMVLHGATEFAAVGGPVEVHESPPRLRLWWADVHAGQCAAGCGAGTADEHYRYARHVAGVHMVTEQSNDHYVTSTVWDELRRAADANDEPGSFVTFLGCEWSPETAAGGDRNVVYRRDAPMLVRSGRYFRERTPDPVPDAPTAPEFHSAFREREVLVNVHVGGRMTNLKWLDDDFERLAEIHSTHGTIEWFVADVLARGHVVGVTAGTDGVMGRPSADQPGWGLVRNLPNGLTGVYAERLDREALWEALRERRCFATTGPRIVLAFETDGAMMGSVVETQTAPSFRVAAAGTAPIERVEFLHGSQVVQQWELGRPRAPEGGRRWITLLWAGTRARGSAQAQRLVWDGTLQLAAGRIVEVEPVGFYGRADELVVCGERTLAWRNATAGNEAGAHLLVEGGDEVTGTFESGPASFAFTLGEAAAGLTFEAGAEARRVRVGPRSEGGPRTVEFEFRDDQLPVGRTPCWVRLTQVDRHRAWSSPIYLVRR
jgi:hypothetical protein